MVQRATLSLSQSWLHSRRWKGITRPYTADDVLRFRGSLLPSYTIATRGCETLWRLLADEPFVRSLNASSGRAAVEQVRAGVKAIYVTGRNDESGAGESDPVLGSVPSTVVARTIRQINNALRWTDQIQAWSGSGETSWFVPVVADVDSGSGGILGVFESVKVLIEAGVAGLQLNDREPAHLRDMGTDSEVLSSTADVVHKLVAARLASDIMGVGTVLMARTHARRARCIQNDRDPIDQAHIIGRRNADGTYPIGGGLDMAIARALVFAPYSDLIGFEPATPDIGEAREFAEAIHSVYPGKFLSYHCDPALIRSRDLADDAIAQFQNRLALHGFKFMYVARPGATAAHAGMFELAGEYAREGMSAFTVRRGREADRGRNGEEPAKQSDASVTATYYEAVRRTIAHVGPTRYGTDSPSEEAQSNVSDDGKTG